MTVEQMRMQVRTLYTSDTWWNKVDKMTDNQIIAIYHRAREAGRLKEGELVVSYPRHAGRDEMMANRIIDAPVIPKMNAGKYVAEGFKAGLKKTNPKIEEAARDIIPKQITFNDLWRNAGYSYVGTSEFMEGATSEGSDDAFGEPQTDENT